MDNTLIHWGVKGMKWGVRKDRGTKQTRLERNEARFRERGYSKSEATSRAKKRIRKQNIAAVIGAATAVAAASYVASDIVLAKRALASDIKRTEEGLKVFEKADELVRKGEAFVRSTYGSDGAWDNPVRTYAMRSSDVAASQMYGNRHFSLKPNSSMRIAGLQKQLEVLQSPEASGIRDAYLRDLLPKNPIGRLVVSRTDTSNLSKAALSYINKTGFGASSDSASELTSQYVNSLLERGYSAVRDTNHATSPAYVLLNKALFDIQKHI